MRLQRSVKDDLAAAVEVSAGLELLVGQGILRADNLATNTLENGAHCDFQQAVLVKVNRRRSGSRLVPQFLLDSGCLNQVPGVAMSEVQHATGGVRAQASDSS